MTFTTRVSISFGGRRSFIAIHGGKDGWCLQAAHPTACGYRFDPPLEKGIPTKRQAIELRRKLYDKARVCPRNEVR